MGRGSAARRQGNVGGGQRRPMMSRGAPRRPIQDRRYATSTDDEGSEHESEEAERRQPTPIDEEGSNHDSAQAEGDNDNESRERSQTRPTSQSTPVDEEGSNHDPAQAEGSNDNESRRRRSQTRPDSIDQSFARAAHTFETAVRSAWNRFELDRIRRDVTPPAPIVERGSTAIYHAPSILQFYFTNTPPGVHTKSNSDHPSDNRAPSISNTQHSPGRDTQNPRKRKRSEGDGDEEDPGSQMPVDTALSDHPSDNRAPNIGNTQPSFDGDTQNPRKRKRSETDDDEDQEGQGAVDSVLAAIEARTLSRADRDALLAALDSAETQSDEGVERNGEGESNDDDIGEEREVSGDGEGVPDDVEMQGNEGVSGYGERPQNTAGIQSDEGGRGDVEGEAHTQESPDGNTIVFVENWKPSSAEGWFIEFGRGSLWFICLPEGPESARYS
ncbi:hypothetical protein KC316_g3204 [Hortaea werneckii]|nr:hypothetical protein KC316_g3204 [Hortaea werneckii]